MRCDGKMTERSVFAFPDDTKAAAAKEKCYAMAVLRASVFHARIIRDFSLAKACMSTATSSFIEINDIGVDRSYFL